MALPTYSTGTVAVTTGGAVTVTGGIWSGTNVVAGDMISVDGGAAVLLSDVSLTAGQIAGWTGGAVGGKTYVVYQCSPLRFDDVQIAQDLQKQVAALNDIGYVVWVATTATVPDPSLGDENQMAFQQSTGKWWQKTGGLWVIATSPFGLQAAANLSDVANTATARTNLGATSLGSLLFTASDAGVAQTALQVGTRGFRNRIINPSGQVNQSGSGTAANGTYWFDQWINLTQSNPVTPSQLIAAEDGTPFMMRTTQSNATTQRFGIIQPIETANCLDMRGKQATLSARVRMSVATTLRYAIISWTGAADAISTNVVRDWTSSTFTGGSFFWGTDQTISGTGSIALAANTLTDITPLTATISSSALNVLVFFWTDSTQAQSVTLDIGNVQFEIGPIATPLALRPFQQELALCQRYFRSSWDYGTLPGTAWTAGLDQVKLAHPSGTFSNGVDFPSMRIAGTLTIYDHLGAAGKVTTFVTSSWSGGGTITTQLAKQSLMWVQHVIASSTFTNFGYKIDARL